MDLKFLDTLHCPYCSSNLQVNKIIQEKGDSIEYGIINCNCFSYPVIEGILVLRIDAFTVRARDYLSANKRQLALSHLIISKRSLKDKVSDRIRRFSFFQKLVDGNKEKCAYQFLAKLSSMSLCQIIDSLNWGTWGDYVKYRYSADSFFETITFLSLLKGQAGYVLDHSCGLGHYSNMIEKAFPSLKIVCTDMNFFFLWLARKYFLDNAEMFCLDENALLPFSDNFFSSILNSDALHYFVSKTLLANEFKRITSPQGIIILSHLHNSLVKQWKGMPLSPAAYAHLFKGWTKNIIPDKPAIDGLFANSFDFSREYDDTEIMLSNSVNLITSNKPDIFEPRANFKKEILAGRNNLIINPIYEIIQRKTSLDMKLMMPNPFYAEDNPFLKEYLPEEYVINKQDINDQHRIQDMIDHFILVDVPKNFLESNNIRQWDYIKNSFS